METTITVEASRLDDDGGKVAVRHNKHDPSYNPKNVQIDHSRTYRNRHVKLRDIDDIAEEHFGKQLEKSRKSLTRRYKEGRITKEEYTSEMAKKTVRGYFTSGKKPKKYLTEFILTLGNVDIEFKMLDALDFDYNRVRVRDKHGNYHSKPEITDPKQREEWLDILWESYMKVVKELNKMPGVQASECWLHADEGGVPHMHVLAVNTAVSPTGKSSFNLNESFKNFCIAKGVNPKKLNTAHTKKADGTKQARVNGEDTFEQFRDLIDPVMLTGFNLALEKRGLGDKLKGSLVRLGTKGNQTMDEYQARKQAQKQLAATCKAMGISPYRKDGKLFAPTTMARKIAKASKEEQQNHKKLNDEKETVKQQENSILDEIALREPNHKVGKERLHDEEPAPISDPKGREQHREQGLDYLTHILLLTIRRTTRALLDAFKDELSDNVPIQNKRSGVLDGPQTVKLAGRPSARSKQYKNSEWLEVTMNGLTNAFYNASESRLRRLQKEREELEKARKENQHEDDLER